MKIVDVSTHNPSRDNIYFLDCNVLMYVFYPNGAYASNLVSEYSQLISKILGAGANIIVTDMLISEFINTYIQLEFHRLANLNGWPHNKAYFKQTFKYSQDYKDLLREIKCILDRQLFPMSKKIDVKFSEIAMDNIFDNPCTFDFNDRYYGLSIFNMNSYIVTNDADFLNVCGSEIITKNSRLLSASV